MEDKRNFLERTRELREALKKRALEVESNIVDDTQPGILEASIKKNIESSLQFYKTNAHDTRNQSYSLKSIINIKSQRIPKVSTFRNDDPFKLPEVKKAFLPYLKKPSEFPLQTHKKIKKYKVSFTGIEPKIKKLNLAYTSLSSRR